MDLKVFIISKEAICGECGRELFRHSWVILADEEGPVCLECADLDHLVFLPSGDAALTRRSAKYSRLSAVVLKWSRNRKRYERQGLLVEEAALQKAEEECLADADVRALRQERDALRRDRLDKEYVASFAERIREIFPNCPAEVEKRIAEHACEKNSGRVGRSASAKELEPEAIVLAVLAHIRHEETNYDELLAQGMERWAARAEVKDQVNAVVTRWQNKYSKVHVVSICKTS